jgi:hypothetical protein
MSTGVYDVATALLTAGAPLAANGQGTGLLLYPRQLGICDWVLAWTGTVATGTYTFNLQVSDVVGGTYTTIASFTVPPTLASGRVHLPIQGQLAAVLDNDSKFMRVNYVIGGTSPGIVVNSWLTDAATNAGLGVRVQDFFTAA